MSTITRQQINLFNPAFQPQKQILSSATIALAIGAVIAGVAILSVIGKMEIAELQQQAASGAAQLEKRQARLASANSEFAPRQKDTTLDAQIAEASAQLAAMRHISGALSRGELGDTSGFAGYFKALARQSAQGLWLTGVTVDAGGSQIGIKGRTVDPAMVPGYLNRLTHEPLMQGKSFASLQIGEAAPLQVQDAEGKPATRPAPYIEFSLQSVPEEPRK
ncbi:PilN domain-containing protein [Massilia sp. HP4]|uniref:PilN domain-containing protein n=1 Tax=Massilia sp. HP4 TaxID=2562316 RepID=UPI0010C11133|nr:PilN domain-containing protein [Massilia sp. HP4]